MIETFVFQRTNDVFFVHNFVKIGKPKDRLRFSVFRPCTPLYLEAHARDVMPQGDDLNGVLELIGTQHFNVTRGKAGECQERPFMG
jgi:hypothetical protein